MLATPVFAAGAGVFAVPVVAVMVFFGSGAADPPASSGMVCTVTVGTDGAAGSPDSVITLSQAQTDQARTIVAAAKALGMDQHAAAVAIMVARQESGLANLANTTVRRAWRYRTRAPATTPIRSGCSSSARRWAGAPWRS